MNVRIIVPDHLQVAFEQRVVTNVEAGDGRVSIEIIHVNSLSGSELTVGQAILTIERQLRSYSHP